jgi:7-carboxy-7-deazaguanine synthase
MGEEILNQEQLAVQKGTMLPLMEEFYTIQGEGANSGKPAYFIRLGGCDVGCHWCDVKESWNADLHPPTAADLIVSHALDYPAKAVVVTGGEPTLYNLNYLTSQFQQHKLEAFLETSGAYPLTGIWDWICLSPKKTSPPLASIFQKANELKVIIYNKNDFDWAEKNAAEIQKVNKNCRLFLQPEWSRCAQMLPLIVDYVMQNPKWNISLQTHKYMHIP